MASPCSVWHDAALMGAYRLKLKAARCRQKHVWSTSCSENLQSLQPALLFAIAEAAQWALQLLRPPSPLLNYWETQHTRTHAQKLSEKEWVSWPAESCCRYTMKSEWVFSACFRTDISGFFTRFTAVCQENLFLFRWVSDHSVSSFQILQLWTLRLR